MILRNRIDAIIAAINELKREVIAEKQYEGEFTAWVEGILEAAAAVLRVFR